MLRHVEASHEAMSDSLSSMSASSSSPQVSLPPFSPIISGLPPSLHPATFLPSTLRHQHPAGIINQNRLYLFNSFNFIETLSALDSGFLGPPHFLPSLSSLEFCSPGFGPGPGDLSEMRHFINRYKYCQHSIPHPRLSPCRGISRQSEI